MPIASRIWRSLVSQRQQPNLPQPLSQTPSQQLSRPQIRRLQAPPRAVDWIPQPWHEFGACPAGHRWAPLGTQEICPSTKRTSSQAPRSAENQSLTLVTWNVNAADLRPRARIAALLSHILALTPAVDVIFLQEVSQLVLKSILENPRVCASWLSTDIDATHWGRQSFAAITLLSKARFHRPPHCAPGDSCMTLGRVWRIKYDSRYSRDALFCDVHVVPPRSNDGESPTDSACIRLVNVHLDSLALRPSHRPGQIATAASALRDAGCGLVAGDFNPVLPEDQTLVTDNGLVDAWTATCGPTGGETWGADRQKRYAPRRMDKVAMLGLDVEAIDILRPGVISSQPMGPDHPGNGPKTHSSQSVVPWSDHSGIRCVLSWPVTAS